MLFDSNLSKVFLQFVKISNKEEENLQLRELSRNIGLAPTSVKNYLKTLEEKELVIKKLHPDNGYPQYYPNKENKEFSYLKNLAIIEAIKTEKIEEILEELEAEIITLKGITPKIDENTGKTLKIIIKTNKQDNYEEIEKKISEKLLNIPVIIEPYEELDEEKTNEVLQGMTIKGKITPEMMKKEITEVNEHEDRPIWAEEIIEETITEEPKHEEIKITTNEDEKENTFYSRTLIKLPGE